MLQLDLPFTKFLKSCLTTQHFWSATICVSENIVHLIVRPKSFFKFWSFFLVQFYAIYPTTTPVIWNQNNPPPFINVDFLSFSLQCRMSCRNIWFSSISPNFGHILGDFRSRFGACSFHIAWKIIAIFGPLTLALSHISKMGKFIYGEN